MKKFFWRIRESIHVVRQIFTKGHYYWDGLAKAEYEVKEFREELEKKNGRIEKLIEASTKWDMTMTGAPNASAEQYVKDCNTSANRIEDLKELESRFQQELRMVMDERNAYAKLLTGDQIDDCRVRIQAKEIGRRIQAKQISEAIAVGVEVRDG